MYFGAVGERGLHHVVYMVVDDAVNATRNVSNGTVDVRILPDGGIRITDNGPGLPVTTFTGEFPETKHPTPIVTLALTRSKLWDTSLDLNYDPFGYSHCFVANGASSRMIATVKRDGYTWRQSFAMGEPDAPLQRLGPTDQTGTSIEFYALPDIFNTVIYYSFETLARRLRDIAFLNKGLTTTITDERPGRPLKSDYVSRTFRYDRGMVEFPSGQED